LRFYSVSHFKHSESYHSTYYSKQFIIKLRPREIMCTCQYSTTVANSWR